MFNIQGITWNMLGIQWQLGFVFFYFILSYSTGFASWQIIDENSHWNLHPKMKCNVFRIDLYVFWFWLKGNPNVESFKKELVVYTIESVVFIFCFSLVITSTCTCSFLVWIPGIAIGSFENTFSQTHENNNIFIRKFGFFCSLLKSYYYKILLLCLF